MPLLLLRPSISNCRSIFTNLSFWSLIKAILISDNVVATDFLVACCMSQNSRLEYCKTMGNDVLVLGLQG